MAFAGILMDYHLIFMLICFGLFFLSIILIWMIGTKEAMITAILFICINALFCIISMVGFYSIGYIGYNQTTGESVIMGYTEMSMFHMIFLVLLWINSAILFVAIFKYERIILHENLGDDSGMSGYRRKFK
jgi:hypothetical protein